MTCRSASHAHSERTDSMGKVATSWELVRRSFQVLKADTELMWLPVLSAVSCVLVSLALFAGGGALFWPSIKSAVDANSEWRPSADLMLGATFVFYLVNHFIIVF